MKYFTHYKNKPYRMIGEAKHSETLEDLVVYECLYDNPTAKLWVRPKEMFFESVAVDGKSIPRFAEVQSPMGSITLHSKEKTEESGSFKLGSAVPQLPSGNIDITERYFNEKLGFNTIAKYIEQNFLIVKRGASEIHFWQAPSEGEAKSLGQESSCYIRVENIGPLFDELKTRGALFRYELTKQPWGMNEMQVDDPYSNAIRFGEPV